MYIMRGKGLTKGMLMYSKSENGADLGEFGLRSARHTRGRRLDRVPNDCFSNNDKQRRAVVFPK